MLKQFIKDLAAQQVQLKKERKTGSLPNLDARIKSNTAASKARRNATKITAALNLYAKLRGKVPCHCWHDDYAYTKAYVELEKLYTQP